jgi:hypothetical protein
VAAQAEARFLYDFRAILSGDESELYDDDIFSSDDSSYMMMRFR